MKKFFFSSMVLLGLQALSAAEYTNFDLSLKAGLTSIDNKDGWSFEKGTLAADSVVDLGYVIKPRIDLVYTSVDEKGGSVKSLWQLALDGQYDIALDPTITVDPYIFGGVGYEYVRGSRKGFDSQFFLQGGAGLKYRVNSDFSLVTEFKALQMLDSSGNDEKNEFVVLIGASMPFHIESTPLDNDRDGVLNADDLCPDTPPGVRVNADGCPLPKAEKRKPLPKPEPAEVQAVVVTPMARPMPTQIVKAPKRVADSDHDGVPDELDECPATPKGFSVNEKGCGTRKQLEVRFESNSATLTPESMQKIRAFAHYMKKMPHISVTIEGYTDSSGDMKHNMQLSQQRANAVKKALIANGISASRITAVGKGALNPIADNDTPEGRAKNRRIEAIIHQ